MNIYRVRHKCVQTSKNHNKKSNARKKLQFAGICSESFWILLFPLKKLVKKMAERWRSHITPKWFMQISIAVKHKALKMDPSFDCSNMLSLPDLALVVKLFYKNGESTMKALQ